MFRILFSPYFTVYLSIPLRLPPRWSRMDPSPDFRKQAQPALVPHSCLPPLGALLAPGLSCAQGGPKSNIAQPASPGSCRCPEHRRPMIDKRRTVMGRLRPSAKVPPGLGLFTVSEMGTNSGARKSAGEERYQQSSTAGKVGRFCLSRRHYGNVSSQVPSPALSNRTGPVSLAEFACPVTRRSRRLLDEIMTKGRPRTYHQAPCSYDRGCNKPSIIVMIVMLVGRRLSAFPPRP
ncbi:hypothetical protein B0I37DRAFT_103828 [Chaetomium sp. MPI-CAGE-AT-0009]|nr:hypothetical protein B0I37DRAFT_103828 [Chaetomium sp. MPI-CAGE-AT-0009]